MCDVIRMRKRHIIENRLVDVDCIGKSKELRFGGEGDLENSLCDGDCFRHGFWFLFRVVVEEEWRDGERVDGLSGYGVFFFGQGGGNIVDWNIGKGW